MTPDYAKYAVFIDIDGTLITDSFKPPEANTLAIRQARKNGHKIFINTGRSWANMPKELLDYVTALDGVVSGNGSHIVLDGKVIHSVTFPDSVLRSLCKFFFSTPGATCLFEGVDRMLLLDNNVGYFRGYDNVISSVSEFEEKLMGMAVSVVAINGVSVEEFKKHFGDEVTVFQFKYFSDCVMCGCNKARGMDILLDAVGIPLEHTIAIGDSMNDLPMLEHSGIGVAMGNAVDALKEAADFVADTNFNSGVAQAINKYLG